MYTQIDEQTGVKWLKEPQSWSEHADIVDDGLHQNTDK